MPKHRIYITMESRALIKILAFVALVLLIPVCGYATTYSVCPSGCDYPTIDDAVDAISGTHIIEIHEGTYTENITQSSDGTDDDNRLIVQNKAGENIVVTSAGGATWLLNGSDYVTFRVNPAGGSFLVKTTDTSYGKTFHLTTGASTYITWDGLRFNSEGDATNQGIRLDVASCTNLKALNCEFDGSQAIWFNPASGYVDTVEIARCDIDKVSNTYAGTNGIYLVASDFTISDCIINGRATAENSDGNGIDVHHFNEGNGGVVERCFIYNNGHNGVSVDASNTILRCNLLALNYHVGADCNAGATAISDNYYQNNIFYGNGRGNSDDGGFYGTNCSDIYLRNNFFINNIGHDVSFGETAASMTLDYNLYYDSEGDTCYFFGGDPAHANTLVDVQANGYETNGDFLSAEEWAVLWVSTDPGETPSNYCYKDADSRGIDEGLSLGYDLIHPTSVWPNFVNRVTGDEIGAYAYPIVGLGTITLPLGGAGGIKTPGLGTIPIVNP